MHQPGAPERELPVRSLQLVGLNGRRASCAFSQLNTTGREGTLKCPEGLGVTRGAVGSHGRFWSQEGRPRPSGPQGRRDGGGARCLVKPHLSPLLTCCRILYTTYYESIASSGPFFGYYFFNGLLMMLQLLHVFWSCLILRMIYSFTKKGQMEKDVRSDVEEADSSDGDVAQESLPLKNGAAPTDGPRSRAAGRLANGHAPAT